MSFRRSTALYVHGLWLIALASFASAGSAQARRPEDFRDIRVVPSISYVGADEADPQRTFDIYLPKERAKNAPAMPILVFFHGGGWVAGDKSSEIEAFAEFSASCVRAGVATAIVNYRLAPKHRHPAQIEDCARAAAYIRDHAGDFGGDPKRLFIGGHSAGGHLAALLAVHPKYGAEAGLRPGDIAGVLAVSGVYSMTGFAGLVGLAFTSKRGDADDATPVTHVAKGAPKFLLIVADHDLPGLRRQARAMTAALTEAKAAPDLREVKDTNHITVMHRAGDPRHPLNEEIVKFLTAKEAAVVKTPTNPEPPTTRRSRL